MDIEMNKNTYFSIPSTDGNVLIMGNLKNVCGKVEWNPNLSGSRLWDDSNDFANEILVNNITELKNAFENNKQIYIIGTEGLKNYFKGFFYSICNIYFRRQPGIKNKLNKLIHCFVIDETKGENEAYKEQFKNIKNMKFDCIIQNPPYSRSLHLDFLKMGIDLLEENGKMVIVEPATWLINVRTNGKAKKYDEIKKQIDGHVESVIIENFNDDFKTGLYTPFSITKIDMSKNYDKINFVCCGEKKEVNSIYDCNMIGCYNTIWSILNKVQNFGDVMKNHVTSTKKGKGMWYAKYHELTARAGVNITSAVHSAGMILENAFSNPVYYKNGYIKDLFHCGYSTIANEIKETPHNTVQRGGANGSHKLTDKIADNVYGSREELENWKHFIFNNKLSLFINIVLTIDQHNNSKEFLPWLVDKKYTDKEINKLFGFTKEETALINKTLLKYKNDTPWFKRYLCGPDSVSDEEINNFIEKL